MEGIPPVVSIAVNFTSHVSYVQSIPGPFSPGQLVTATLSGLEAETEYNFTLFAVNFNGLSPGSVQNTARTGMLPSHCMKLMCYHELNLLFPLMTQPCIIQQVHNYNV